MQIEKISLTHQKLLQPRLKSVSCLLSEYSFANLYLFREAHQHEIIKEGHCVYVGGRMYGGLRYVMPTEKITAANAGALLEAAREYDCVFPVPRDWLEVFGAAAICDYSDDDSDYVYTLEKLAAYKGQKLHGQKNLLNQFLARFVPEALPLTQDRMRDALDILDTWQADIGEDKNATDYFPCREAFELYDALVLCGGIYYVEGEPAGFIIGEEITPEMFALHFAKGKRKFKGLYQYMFNHFAKILPRQYAFLNFEQDLGKLALRIAKSSYDPDHLLRKYRVKMPLA